MSILILDNYDSFTYNLYQRVQAQTERPVQVYRNDALAWDALRALHPSHIILSPGPGHPQHPGDFGVCREVILHHEELNCPVLGVCLGHQGLAHYTGGAVVPAPSIVHGKTSSIRLLSESPLFEGIASPMTVMRYHSWTVDPKSLSPDWQVLASTDDADELLMAMQHRHKPWFGVQFHPESIGTPQGDSLLWNFIHRCRAPERLSTIESPVRAV